MSEERKEARKLQELIAELEFALELVVDGDLVEAQEALQNQSGTIDTILKEGEWEDAE